MKRVISLYLHTWPTDQVRRRLGKSAPSAETPLILVAKVGNKRIVTAADKRAQSQGIKIGMAATQASALVVGLHMEEANPGADNASLEKLAQWVFRHYSPLVGTDEPDGLRIDATGAAHLYGGEAAMLKSLLSRLKASGIGARVAMAPTYGAAHALARYRRTSTLITSTEECVTLLNALPIAGLRLAPKVVDGIRMLGFETINELCNTPRAPLALRFGKDISKRINQAFGYEPEPFEPVIPADLLIVRQIFADPIATPEQLSHFTGQLVEKICHALERTQSGAKCLDLQFHRIDNRIEAIRIGLAKPARDIKRLTKLLCDKLDTVEPGLGVELITLSAPWVESLTFEQTITRLGEKSKPDIASLIDVLNNRLGPGHVYQTIPIESQVPERCVKHVPPLVDVERGKTLPHQWTRPTRLFSHPEPVQIIGLLPDHAPVSFTWRGKRRKVTRADGPERVFGEWWLRNEELYAVRDYFQVEDEKGERFWLFRAGDGVHEITGSQSWFIHGMFA